MVAGKTRLKYGNLKLNKHVCDRKSRSGLRMCPGREIVSKDLVWLPELFTRCC